MIVKRARMARKARRSDLCNLNPQRETTITRTMDNEEAIFWHSLATIFTTSMQTWRPRAGYFTVSALLRFIYLVLLIPHPSPTK